MLRRSLLFCLLLAGPLAASAGEPVRLDAPALGAVAIDPEEARAARQANDRLRDAFWLSETDIDRQRGARLDELRLIRPNRPGANGGDPPGEPADE